MSISTRLFLTVALIYGLHFSTNVVRETYLAVALGENLSIRVDRFVGLHPDLFEIPGRGAFITGNPGASMLAAVPYALAHPALEVVYRWKPSLVAPKPPAAYDDPRPNRTRFMNEMRARGMDVRLALAAAVIHAGFNVPLGAAAAVAMFLFLRSRLRDERAALWFALLFAFGTPVFFRSAFLNQNLVLAHCAFFAFLALVSRPEAPTARLAHTSRPLAAGALLGVGLLCDYSAVPLLVAFGVWSAWRGAAEAGAPGALRSSAAFMMGAAGPIAVLLLYQYAAFGNPMLPAQAYMPRTDLSVHGWYGFQLPTLNLLWRNLLDPGYGLFAFCPMLAAAFFAPLYRNTPHGVTRQELLLIYAGCLGLYAFSSSVAFAALQWNTGVRYLVPAVPLLFVALVPVLRNIPRGLAWLLIVPTVIISWCVSMARESVPISLLRIFTLGPELPWHTVLQKTSPAYFPTLAAGGAPLVIFMLAGVVVWLIWSCGSMERRSVPRRMREHS